MDLALLVKQDMAPKAGDPFSHAISATFIQYHNSTEVNLAFSHIIAFSVLLLHVLGSLLLSNVIESGIDTDFCMGFINIEVMDLDGKMLNSSSKC